MPVRIGGQIRNTGHVVTYTNLAGLMGLVESHYLGNNSVTGHNIPPPRIITVGIHTGNTY